MATHVMPQLEKEINKMIESNNLMKPTQEETFKEKSSSFLFKNSQFFSENGSEDLNPISKEEQNPIFYEDDNMIFNSYGTKIKNLERGGYHLLSESDAQIRKLHDQISFYNFRESQKNVSDLFSSNNSPVLDKPSAEDKQKNNEGSLRRMFLLDLKVFYQKFYLFPQKLETKSMNRLENFKLLLMYDVAKRHSMKIKGEAPDLKVIRTLDLKTFFGIVETQKIKIRNEQKIKQIFKSFFSHLRKSFLEKVKNFEKIENESELEIFRKINLSLESIKIKKLKENYLRSSFNQVVFFEKISKYKQIHERIHSDLENCSKIEFNRLIRFHEFFEYLERTNDQITKKEGDEISSKRDYVSFSENMTQNRNMFWKDIVMDILSERKSNKRSPLKRSNNWRNDKATNFNNIKGDFKYVIGLNQELEGTFNDFTDPDISNDFQDSHSEKIESQVNKIIKEFQTELKTKISKEMIVNDKDQQLKLYTSILLEYIDKKEYKCVELPWFSHVIEESIDLCRQNFYTICKSNLDNCKEAVKNFHKFLIFVENHYTFREYFESRNNQV